MDKVEINKNKIIQYLISLVVSIIASLFLIIIFALFIKWFSLKDSVISPINMVIKAISILLGLVFVFKIDKSKGLIKGVCFGVIYSILAFVIFSILAGAFSLGVSIILDMVFCGVAGGILGVLLVNMKR